MPEIRQLDNHIFTVVVDMKNKDPENLLMEAVYFFHVGQSVEFNVRM